MADDSVVDDDESKIVTKFLLDTCRLRQPSRHSVCAVMLCAAMMTKNNHKTKECYTERAETRHLSILDNIPLTTGSVAEFYIQSVLSCVGDVDIMYHRSDELAIPDGRHPPSQLPAEFDSGIEVYEIIDSEYPGYVYLVSSYLLRENIDADKYDVITMSCRMCEHARYRDSPITESDGCLHGPAYTTHLRKLSLDTVHCIRCLSWPTQAADWPTRHRNYRWPDSATVDRVVGNGCDVVCVAHRLCRQDEWMNCQYRLSFS